MGSLVGSVEREVVKMGTAEAWLATWDDRRGFGAPRAARAEEWVPSQS